ncbi:hypothetical protein GWK47_002358 [Chionoecetes opilio]|uniref:Uncharacterized protein n=1 Tax=Chionoecetes opilio TaxID=41210 RepID=A0A8J4XPD7_CHIOP|nr:hypothetical protein GWK47_002358 [Chionoecetes opilio]
MATTVSIIHPRVLPSSRPSSRPGSSRLTTASSRPAVDEPYEICPYATFSMPPGIHVPPGSAGRGTLDYTLQFHTFGHQNVRGPKPRPAEGIRRPLWAAGGLTAAVDQRRCLRGDRVHLHPANASHLLCACGGGVGGRRKWKRWRRGRFTVDRRVSRTPVAVPAGCEASQGTRTRCLSGSASADFSFHPPDSAWSNDERPPSPRRPQHLPPPPQLPLTDSMPVHLLHHLTGPE